MYRQDMQPIVLDDFSGGVWRELSGSAANNTQAREMWNYLVEEKTLKKRSGCAKHNAVEIGSSLNCRGLAQHFDGDAYRVFAKFGTRVFDVQQTGQSNYIIGVTEAGDANDQLSDWVVTGANSGNTNAGELYWKLTDSAGTRTVDLYKNADGQSGNKVATGSRAGDGVIVLSAVNGSGMAGFVTVAYTEDDTDLAANTLTFGALDEDAWVNFVPWAGMCFFADGANLYALSTGNASPVTWLDENGDSTDDWTIKPTPKSIVLHKEHLWWIDAGSSRVGFTVRNHYDRIWENTVDANNYGSWVACDADDGRELVALVSNGDELMAFKRQKYFLITGDYDETSNTLAVISGDMVGAFNQNSVDACSDGFIRWVGPDGVFEYRRDVGVRPISQAIDYDLRMIAPENWDTVCAKFWGRRFHVFWTYNNECVGAAFDTTHRCWMPLRGWNVAVLARFASDDTLYAGWEGAGYVKRLFYGLADDGAEIACYRKSHKIAAPKMEMVLDGVRCLLRSGQSVTITAVNESGRTRSKIFIMPDVGTYLADEDHPEYGGFELEDEENPIYGDIMVSEDELGLGVGEKAGRFPGSFNFRFLEVITQESSVDQHEIERIELDVYPGRQV